MVAMAKAFSKQDSLKLKEQIEPFLEQFNLDEQKVVELEKEWGSGNDSFALKYKFTKEELNEFENNFENLGMKAYAKKYRRDEQQIEQLIFGLKYEGREIFRKNRSNPFSQKKMQDLEDEFKKSRDRSQFAKKHQLTNEEMKGFETEFTGFGKKSFALKYKFHDAEVTEFDVSINDYFITLGRKAFFRNVQAQHLGD